MKHLILVELINQYWVGDLQNPNISVLGQSSGIGSDIKKENVPVDQILKWRFSTFHGIKTASNNTLTFAIGRGTFT